MKPSIPFTRTCENPDAVRWFVIGAYQAGASEPEIVSLTNLSRQTVGYIISCFKRTGMPNVRRRKRIDGPMGPTTTTNKKGLLTHYDAWSDLEEECSDSSSDDEYDTDSDDTEFGLDIKKEEQDEQHLAWKQALYFRRKGKSKATDTIDYVLYKGRKHEEKRISSQQKLQKQRKKYQQKQGENNNQYDVCPSSLQPPNLNDLLIPKSEPNPISPTPSDPPPSNVLSSSQQLCIPSVYSLINTVNDNTITNTSSSPSSPSTNDTNQHLDEYLTFSISATSSPSSLSSPSSSSSSLSSSSSSLSSSSSSPILQSLSNTENHHDENYRYDRPAREFKYWSRADDKLLLYYVLTHMRCWDELDRIFEGRHTALDCSERWDLLQHYLFKELKKAGTYGW